MSLGLFDVVGPVMHGPSSNHTAGATRIGYLARRIMGDVPRNLTFAFHPLFMNVFAGHRTHIALLAGCLGYREDEGEVNDSFAKAEKLGINVDYIAVHDPEAHRNTMGVRGKAAGIDWDINCISIGGGNIVINCLNGVTLNYNGNNWLQLYMLKKGTPREKAYLLAKTKHPAESNELYQGEGDRTDIFCLETKEQIPEEEVRKYKILLGEENVLAQRQVAPLYPFAEKSSEKPLFNTYCELAEAAKNRTLIDVVLEYETRRSGKPESAVMAEGLRIVDVIIKSMDKALCRLMMWWTDLPTPSGGCLMN